MKCPSNHLKKSTSLNLLKKLSFMYIKIYMRVHHEMNPTINYTNYISTSNSTTQMR